MTPDALLTYVRQQYNATADDFFSDDELYTHVWSAENILARECKVIENTYSTTTVAGQREYSYPTTAIAIKRITYDGQALDPITFAEDDTLTGFLENTTGTGTPTDYVIFDKTIYLRPVPDDAKTLQIYSFDSPSQVSSTSSLDVPEEFHLGLCEYVLWRMALKDQNPQAASLYKANWDEEKERCRAWARKRLIAGGFRVVKDENARDLRWWRP